jgi:aminoglycoside phosphotransferase (APT) family kinase protein
VRLLLRTPRFRASGHVLLFAFPEGAREPTLVAKVARLPGPSPSLDREASALAALAETAGSIAGVPGLMERMSAGRSAAIVETIVPGNPVHPAKVRRDPERHMEIFCAWIGDLHRRTRVYAITNGWWQEVVEGPLSRIEEFFGSGSREAKLAARTRERVSPLRDVATSWVLEHGDLSAPNLLLDGDRPGIVDWELGTRHGLPAADLFFFLGFVAFARDRAESADAARGALRRAFFGKDPWAAPRVRRYAEAVGVPAVQLPALYVLAWARNVASYLERLADEGGPAASTEALRAWLRRERCFAAWADAVERFDSLDPDGSVGSAS